jgi:RHS repeat-associated protein
LIDVLESRGRSFVVWKNKGKRGWDRPVIQTKKALDLDEVNFNDPHFQLADITGDGGQDIVRVRSGRIDYWPSLGNGRFGDRISMKNSPRLSRLSNYLDRVFWMDVSGNGCADLVVFSENGVHVFYNQNGIKLTDGQEILSTPIAIPDSIRVVDFFGTGNAGLLYNTYRSGEKTYFYLSFGSTQPSFFLQKVLNGHGLESSLNYKPATHFYLQDYKKGNKWETNFPFPLHVVSSIEERDLITGQHSKSTYTYHEAHFEKQTRQFQGFRKVERLEKGDESQPDLLTIHYFLMGQELKPGNSHSHVALNGKLSRVETYGLNGTEDETLPICVEESDYQLEQLLDNGEDLGRIFLAVKAYRTIDIERSEDQRVEEKKYSYDDLGNVIREERHGYGMINGQPAQEKKLITEIEYAKNQNKWILDRVSRAVSYNEEGEILAENRKYYDGVDYEGLPLGQVGRGLLSRETRLVWPEEKFNVHYAGMDMGELGYFIDEIDQGKHGVYINHKRVKYDQKGLTVGEKDAMGHEVTFVYNPNGLFKEEYHSILGINKYTYEEHTGGVTEVNGPDGAIIRMSYDALGRLVNVFTPDNKSDVPSRRYEYDITSIPFKRTTKFYRSENWDDYSKVVTYFNGASKDFQNRVECGPGQYTVSEYNLKNSLGKTKVEYPPFFSDTESFTLPDLEQEECQRFYYDAKGRPLKSHNYFGGFSSAEYRPFEVISRDPIDNDSSSENIAAGLSNTPKVEQFDVFQNRTKTIYHLEDSEKTELGYEVDETGQLRKLFDDKGLIASYEFDNLGNRIMVDHREAGVRKVWYNAMKQPVKGIDAKGNVITAVYDDLNRIKQMEANEEVVEHYTYDSAENNALGRLAEVSYEEGKQAFFYDDNGNVVNKECHFEGKSDPFSLGFSYDRLGRQQSITHDDGTKISYDYSPNGWVMALDGFLKEVTYDPMGNPLQIEYVNGVCTNRTYSPGGRKVVTQKTTNDKNQKLEELEYVYNKMGLLVQVLDKTGSELKETKINYNALDEVVRHQTEQSGQSTSYQYEFEDHLNLKSFGETFSLFEYEDSGKPSRMSRINQSDGSSVDLEYDLNGNLLNLPGKTFSYNYKNELVSFEAESGEKATYAYNHKQIRIRKTVQDASGNSKTTYFLGRLAEFKESQRAFFVYLGNAMVGILKNGQHRYVHGNYSGNTSFFSDDTGTKIASIAYKPYGNVESTVGSVDHRLYGTHPYDEESGLIYMKKRYYAPELGRFMTPDPIGVFMPQKVIGSIKALHPYAYAGNDPLNNVDLDGLSFWSVFGAIVGVALIGALAVATMGASLNFIFLLTAFAGYIGVQMIGYSLASNYRGSPFGEFMRGFLIGMNAALNAVIATSIFGPVIGIALGVINFLASVDRIAENTIYQGVLGWSSWAMPMSWLVTGVFGLTYFAINVSVDFFSQAEDLKVKVSIDWSTGVVIVEGGLAEKGLNKTGTYGLSLGNFAFLKKGDLSKSRDHEIGHGFSVGAYGSLFHLIGALDQRISGNNALAEIFAESNDPPNRRSFEVIPELDMWG